MSIHIRRKVSKPVNEAANFDLDDWDDDELRNLDNKKEISGTGNARQQIQARVGNNLIDQKTFIHELRKRLPVKDSVFSGMNFRTAAESEYNWPSLYFSKHYENASKATPKKIDTVFDSCREFGWKMLDNGVLEYVDAKYTKSKPFNHADYINSLIQEKRNYIVSEIEKVMKDQELFNLANNIVESVSKNINKLESNRTIWSYSISKDNAFYAIHYCNYHDQDDVLIIGATEYLIGEEGIDTNEFHDLEKAAKKFKKAIEDKDANPLRKLVASEMFPALLNGHVAWKYVYNIHKRFREIYGYGYYNDNESYKIVDLAKFVYDNVQTRKDPDVLRQNFFTDRWHTKCMSQRYYDDLYDKFTIDGRRPYLIACEYFYANYLTVYYLKDEGFRTIIDYYIVDNRDHSIISSNDAAEYSYKHYIG